MPTLHETRTAPHLITLSPEDREKIFTSALHVLEHTGITVVDGPTRSLLADAGARVDADRVRIPSHLVERALETAPREIQIYSRDGQPAMHLAGGKSHFGNGTDCPQILDPLTGQRRKFLRADIERAGVLCDALRHFDFVMPTGVASDVPPPIADIHHVHAMMMNTPKPIIFTAYTPENHRDIVRMAAIAAGGEDELRAKPRVITYTQPISPLVFPEEVCQKVIFCARNGVPVICTPAPMSGASGPATAEGTAVLCLAECLASIVIGQTAKPGAPMITIGIPILMNMRTGAISFDAPELQLMSTALLDLRDLVPLPMWGMAAATDTKIPDEQAAITAALSCTFQTLAGANLIHGIGCLESGMTTSFDLIVMTDAIIGMLRGCLRGMNLDSAHLALDVIDGVGPGGEYVSHGHTLAHFREMWDSPLIDRGSHDTWAGKGSKSLGQRAHERVREILEHHRPQPMDADKSKAIAEILRRREASL